MEYLLKVSPQEFEQIWNGLGAQPASVTEATRAKLRVQVEEQEKELIRASEEAIANRIRPVKAKKPKAGVENAAQG